MSNFQIEYAKFSYYKPSTPPGEAMDWSLKGNVLDMQKGRRLGIGIQQNMADKELLDRGVDWIYAKFGNFAEYVKSSGTPLNRMISFCDNPDQWLYFSQLFLQGKLTSDWTYGYREGWLNMNDGGGSDCERFVRYFIAQMGGVLPFILVLASESYGPAWSYRMTANIAGKQAYAIMRMLNEFSQATVGGHVICDYASNFDAQIMIDTNNLDEMAEAMKSPDTAYDFMIKHESGDVQYWKQKYHELGIPLLQSTYYLNRRNDYQWQFKCLAELSIARLAMQCDRVKTKAKILAYRFPLGYQNFSITELLRDFQVYAGLVDGQQFPIPDYQAAIGQAVVELFFCEYVNDWTEGQRPGPDKRILEQSGYGLNFRGNGKEDKRLPVGYQFQPGGAGYVPKIYSQINGFFDGARWFNDFMKWTANADPTFVRYRKAARKAQPASNGMPAVEARPAEEWITLDYKSLVTQYKKGEPLAYMLQGPDDGTISQEAIYFYKNGGDYDVYEFDTRKYLFTPEFHEQAHNAPNAFAIRAKRITTN